MRLTCKSVHYAMKTFSGKNGYSSDGILYVMGVFIRLGNKYNGADQ